MPQASVAKPIARHKTAIKRRKFSKPVQLLLDDGILSKEAAFFDYGCGYGEDLSFLKKLGFDVAGWDPYFAAENERKPASIVNLGFILNIIEDVEERRETLRAAFDLAQDLLVVSVMIRDAIDESNPLEKPMGDGIITSWSTFQKYYKQAEFKEFLKATLETGIDMAGLGVAYIFKSDRYKEHYLSSRINSRSSDLIAQLKEEEYREKVGAWLNLYHELGRPPAKTEFADYAYIMRAFGSIEAAEELVRAELNEETIKENAERRKNALVVHLCRQLIKTDNRLKLADVDTGYSADLKLFYGRFDVARLEALQKMKDLAQLETVSRYINESQVGKVLPDDIYIHVDSLSHAPEMLQILVELALTLLPQDVPYNMVKIARNGHHVSFLHYPRFHQDPHPALEGAMKIVLHKNQMKYRDYRRSDNPPILHRKETFLHSGHRHYEMYSQLTTAEEEMGLLGSNKIGHRNQWTDLLLEQDLIIANHMIMKGAKDFYHLLAAIEEEDEELVAEILQDDVPMQAANEFGQQPIHVAATNGNLKILKLVVEKTENINIQESGQGYTALHLAAMNGYKSLVKHLLAKGADVTILDHDKMTAKQWAEEEGFELEF